MAEGSTSTTNRISGSRCWRMWAELKANLNDSSLGGLFCPIQTFGLILEEMLGGLAMELKFLMNLRKKLANPRNIWSFLIVCGRGHDRAALRVHLHTLRANDITQKMHQRWWKEQFFDLEEQPVFMEPLQDLSNVRAVLREREEKYSQYKWSEIQTNSYKNVHSWTPGTQKTRSPGHTASPDIRCALMGLRIPFSIRHPSGWE